MFTSDKGNELLLKYTQDALNSAKGEVQVLKDWNQSLQAECRELRDIIYRRFGLVVDPTPIPHPQNVMPQQPARNWSQIKSSLERAHRVNQPSELVAVQKYWEDKLKKEEAEEGNHAEISGEKAEG